MILHGTLVGPFVMALVYVGRQKVWLCRNVHAEAAEFLQEYLPPEGLSDTIAGS